MTIKAAIYNQWCITTGADFRKNLRYTDKSLDPIENPNFDEDCPVTASNQRLIAAPKDLTGYTAKMDIREREDVSSTLLISLTDTSGITIGSPNPTDGTIEIFIDNAVTNVTPFTDYKGEKVYYNLVLIESGGDVQPVLRGSIRILDSITDLTGA